MGQNLKYAVTNIMTVPIKNHKLTKNDKTRNTPARK